MYQVAPGASATRRRCGRGDICTGARVIPDVRLIVRQRHARFNPPGPIDNERLLKETLFCVQMFARPARRCQCASVFSTNRPRSGAIPRADLPQ
ncbi:hypothetical protein L493_2954 [Bordetella bronchiseptica 99-R-0433]|nr:hypothetical protein L493_2954 [Bordetella bronchiseptica 99-R-0433]